MVDLRPFKYDLLIVNSVLQFTIHWLKTIAGIAMKGLFRNIEIDISGSLCPPSGFGNG